VTVGPSPKGGAGAGSAPLKSAPVGGVLHLVQRGGAERGRSPPRPLLAVPNVTAHTSRASVPITELLYNVCCSVVLMCPLKG